MLSICWSLLSYPWNLVHESKTISEAPFSKKIFLPSSIVITDILFLADEKGNYKIISYLFLVSYLSKYFI
jgi:hypothetical protein